MRLLRPLVRQRASALFDLVAGFVYSQTLQACVQLELFEILRDGPLSGVQLVDRVQLPAPALLALLDAAAATGLVQRVGDEFALGPQGAVLLANPSLLAMIRHHEHFYRDLSDPLAMLRGEVKAELAAYWPYAAGDVSSDAAQRYSDLMSQSQIMVAEQVVAAYDFGLHRCLLDIGGGDGTFLSEVGEHFPALDLKLFDLPPVAELARRKLAEDDSRIEAFGGSFADDPLPEGADLVSLIRIVHDHDDPTVMALFRRIFDYLPPGGRLLIAEPMAETTGARAIAGAYFSLYFKAMGSGRPRSLKELRGFLERVGFVLFEHHPTALPLMASVVTVQKPSPPPEIDGEGNVTKS
ncbi:MAG: methyltransferase [Pseudomonadota bacterium]